MKKRNLLLAAALAAALALPVGNVSAEEGKTFKIAVVMHPLNQDEDFNNKEIYKLAEEATGIHIEWIPISSAEAEDKVNIMLASDLPDAFLGLIGETQISNNMDSFADLSQDDLLKTAAPHVYADYETFGGTEDLTWPDGSIRSLMTGRQTSYENDAMGILWMNKAWLDELGMDVPSTTDEFLDVLRAFRDNDKTGNGDTIPFLPSQSDWCSKIMNVANFWGIAGTNSSDQSAYMMIEDGTTVKGTVNTEEFRSFLEYAHQLVSEGLLDVEAFSQTSDQYYAKISAGRVGCYYSWTPNSDMSDDLAKNYVAVGAITAPDGNGYVKSGSQDQLAANLTGFTITSACDDVAGLLSWWDYISSSTELKYISRFGAQGGAWDVDENGQIYEKMPDELSDTFTIEDYKYTYGMVDYGPLILKDENAAISEEISYTSWLRIQGVDVVHEYCIPVENQIPSRFVDPEKTNERTFMETELFTYIQNFTATSIIDGLDDNSWNAYLNQLDALQYSDWLQWYQDLLDGVF